MKRTLERLKTVLVFVFGIVGTLDFLGRHHSTPEILGFAAGIAALTLVPALPHIRHDQLGGVAVAKSALAAVVLGGVLLATILVVHSWNWIVLAGILLAIGLIGEGIDHVNDRAGLPAAPEPELRKPPSDVWQNLPRF